jgi:hypothetical protein
LAMVHQHLSCHFSGDHLVLILPLWTALCGALSRNKWLSTALQQWWVAQSWEQAFTTIMPQMLWHLSHRIWWHTRLCFEHDGAHTDPLDVQWLTTWRVKYGYCDFSATLCDCVYMFHWPYCTTWCITVQLVLQVLTLVLALLQYHQIKVK